MARTNPAERRLAIDASRPGALRLAINVRPLIPTRIGGMEVYARRVVAELLRYDGSHIDAMTVFTSRDNHEALRFEDARVRKVLIGDADAVPEMLTVLRSDGVQALFCPLVALEPREPQIPSFVTIPDLQHEAYPHFFGPTTLAALRELYPASVGHASRVFTISQFSRHALTEAYGVDPDKVVVVALGADEAFRQGYDGEERAQVRRRYAVPPRYVLYPAITWPHKNHGALLRAVQMFNEKRAPLTVVLTGNAGPAHDAVLHEVEALGLAAHTRFLGHIPQRDLACLYRDALAMVFPSLFEGFGLPILESFHSGCPVVCSRTTSCPEVAGPAALYIDPDDPATIAAALQRLDSSPAERTRLIIAGREQAARFTWQDTGRQTFETIRTVVEQARRPEWVYRYADQRFNRPDQRMPTEARQSVRAYGASVVLTVWFNRHRPSSWGPAVRKAFRQLLPHGWLSASAFRDRWPDGWISQRYATEISVTPESRMIVIRGRHLMPGRQALRLSVLLEGASVGTHVLTDRGPFTIHVPCPGGGEGVLRLELIASRTFRPIYRFMAGGSHDARPLACVIDEVSAV